MNKITSLLVALFATTALWAYDFQSGDLCYNITSDTTVEVTCLEKWNNYQNLTNVVIPMLVENEGKNYKVTRIGAFAFNFCRTITSVSIPSSINAIEEYAFHYCTFQSIAIPEGVERIGSQAFSDCEKLKSITLPQSLTTIEDWAFSGCKDLETFFIPKKVTQIGVCALGNCSRLTSIVVDDKNTTFDSRNNCNAIINTTTNALIVGCNATIIPSNVTSIPNWAFNGCENLGSITIPSGVEYIGKYAFVSCSNLRSIVVESGNTIYDSRDNCNAIIETATNTLLSGCLTTQIPNNVQVIGEWAFYGSSNLASIVIPEGVVTIEDAAFEFCGNLSSVTLPQTLTYIGSGAFEFSNLQSIAIPEAVVYIGSGAFWECKFTEFAFPSQITTIESYVLCYCTGLKSITIPNKATEIKNNAFYSCSSLTSVTIGYNVETIGNNAFASCANLKTVTVLADVPPVCDASFDTERLAQMTLLVAPEVLTAYQIADTWKDFGNIVAIGTTDVEDITGSTSNAQKVIIRNGQVLIRQGNTLYNLAGVPMENN